MDRPIWEPSAARKAGANLTAFMAAIRRDWSVDLNDYAALYDFSVASPEKFWRSVWDFCGIIATHRGETVVQDVDRMPGARWFPEARLNFAENLLRRRDAAAALIHLREDGPPRRLSFARLHAEVSRLAQAMRDAGVGPGDRVAGYVPNLPETVIAMLAAASLGAIWCVCSPELGVEAAHDRLGQVSPKLLLVADGYSHGGRWFATLDKAAALAARIDSIERLVVVANRGRPVDAGRLPAGIGYDEFVGPFAAGAIDFAQLPFDHPLFILFSSGTTGAPKCILHGAGGSLLESVKGHVLQFDVRRDDRVFWWTTTGWVVWNMLVTALACEATLLLYDGSPFHPSPTLLWDVAAAERVTFLRLTPKYVETIAAAGIEPRLSHDLSALRCITVGGAPFGAAGYDYVYGKVKPDVHVASPAGGTDPMAALVTGNPIGPVFAGEIQARGLGIGIDVFDDFGRPLRGRPGELVCTRPFPSMPLGYWNDPGGERFRAAYFSRFPGIWAHGDWAEITPRGGVVIHGRSDTTLKVRGNRIGTAEIYRPLEAIAEILDCVAVASTAAGEEGIVLFVRLGDGRALDAALAARIRDRLRDSASPRHVPDRIVEVADVPRTATGKVSEAAVAAVVNGRPVANRDALLNPEALDGFAPERLRAAF